MAKRTPQNSFGTILTVCAAIAFGLIALVMLYAAATSSTDLRSRAALTEQTNKRWEFADNGKKEGWTAKFIDRLQVTGGALTGRIVRGENRERLPRIRHYQVKANLPAGNKYISLRVGVSKSGQENVQGENTGYSETEATAVFGVDGQTILTEETNVDRDAVSESARHATPHYLIYYKLKGRPGFERPLFAQAVIDGVSREVKLQFPQIANIEVERLRIYFVGKEFNGTKFSVDWIRLSAVPVSVSIATTATPTPVNGCRDARNGASCTISVCPSCPPGQTVCPMRPCYLLPGRCNNEHCVPTEEQPQQTPPPGCYFQHVECFAAPCDPIVVCPTGRGGGSSGNGGCVVTGCNGERCLSESQVKNGAGISPCVYLEQYSCLSQSRCERQPSGQCGWTQTEGYKVCMQRYAQPSGQSSGQQSGQWFGVSGQ